MPLPETSNTSGGESKAPAGTRSPASETGDLTSQVDFYQVSDNSPAVVENDPNTAFDEDVSGESQGADDDEGATTEEAGEVEDEEEEGSADEAIPDEGGEGEDEAEGTKEITKVEKTTSVSVGDKDYDLPLTATIPVTVNGEVVQATVQDMMNAFSSKANIRKEVEQAKAAKSEIAVHRRKMLRDIEKKEVALVEKEFATKRGREYLENGEFESALNEFFEYKYEHWDKFDALMAPYYSKFATLPPEKIKNIQLGRQNQLSEIRARIATQATAMQDGINQFNTYKQQRCENTGLSEEEVEDAWDGIVERANKGEFNAAQIKSLNDASPHQKWDTAMAEALATKTRGKITDVIKGEFPKLENKVADIIKEMEDKLSSKFLIKASKEDIAKIVSRDYNEGKPGKTGKKVAPTNSLRDKAQPRHKLGEAATQEDDDDVYDQDGRDEPTSQVWGMSR